jgi:release factor glutamine methyltransferase
MNWLFRRLFLPLPAMVRWYLSTTRTYRAHGLTIDVFPGVFHPGLFFSTEMLLQYLSHQRIDGKTLLEVGAGSGMVSLYAASRGARVSATDISPTAIRNIRHNAALNKLNVSIVQSDLFAHIAGRYDWIVVNPPYYAKTPVMEADHAWYCGQNHDYFAAFFSGLAARMDTACQVKMVLSDVCDLSRICAMAIENNFELVKEVEKTVWADGRNYIFSIKQIA